MSATIKHGTYAGSQQHYALKVPMCDECRQARTDWVRNYRRQTMQTRRTLVPVELVEYLRHNSKDPVVRRMLQLEDQTA